MMETIMGLVEDELPGLVWHSDGVMLYSDSLPLDSLECGLKMRFLQFLQLRCVTRVLSLQLYDHCPYCMVFDRPGGAEIRVGFLKPHHLSTIQVLGYSIVRVFQIFT